MAVPWRPIAALACALVAQLLLEPPNRQAAPGIAFYVSAMGLLVWSAWRGVWALAAQAASASGRDPLTVRWKPFFVSAILLIPVFIFLGGATITPGMSLPVLLVRMFGLQDNQFTLFNLMLWLLMLALFVGSLWLNEKQETSFWNRAKEFIRRASWQITIDRWMLLLLAAAAVVLFFRLYHLQQTPAEPFSDHAEKILDVYDVSQGQTHIFFPRNTGREAIQMYWTLLMSWIFHTGLTFLSLKIGTILIGVLTLPFMYLLGKEIGDALVGRQRFLAIDIVRRHVPLLEARLDVHRIAGQQHGARFRKLDEQNLMSRRMPGRREDRHTAVAKDIVISLQLGDRMLGFEAGAERRWPFIFGLLHQ
jgi:hypothetical protein